MNDVFGRRHLIQHRKPARTAVYGRFLAPDIPVSKGIRTAHVQIRDSQEVVFSLSALVTRWSAALSSAGQCTVGGRQHHFSLSVTSWNQESDPVSPKAPEGARNDQESTIYAEMAGTRGIIKAQIWAKTMG